MPIVIVADQRASSKGPDLVAPVSDLLNRRHGEQLALRFVRTAGDEMQAVLVGDTPILRPLVTELLETRAWWIGLGIGTVSRLGATSRESAGPAFRAARDAIEAAKHDRHSPGPVAVRGEPERVAAWLQAALGGYDYIRAGRTARQREVVHAVAGAPSARAAAEGLAITPQTVSRTLSAAGYEQEIQLGRLIDDLAAQATVA